MDVVLLVAAAVAGFGPSFWLGYRVGVRCRKLPESRYWAANAVGLAIGFVLATLGALLSLMWLWIAALGVMTGSLSGLKYGLGKLEWIRRLMGETSGKGDQDRRGRRTDIVRPHRATARRRSRRSEPPTNGL